MSTPIPPAPGPDWTFAAPPGWHAPIGFDPAHGHVADPTWPPAPPGWVFWTKTAVPASAKDSLVKRIGWVRIVIGLGAVVLLVTRFTGGGSPATGVGSCWKLDSGSSYVAVDCGDGSATVKVVSQTSDPSTCADTNTGYLDSRQDGETRYQCLEPYAH